MKHITTKKSDNQKHFKNLTDQNECTVSAARNVIINNQKHKPFNSNLERVSDIVQIHDSEQFDMPSTNVVTFKADIHGENQRHLKDSNNQNNNMVNSASKESIKLINKELYTILPHDFESIVLQYNVQESSDVVFDKNMMISEFERSNVYYDDIELSSLNISDETIIDSNKCDDVIITRLNKSNDVIIISLNEKNEDMTQSNENSEMMNNSSNKENTTKIYGSKKRKLSSLRPCDASKSKIKIEANKQKHNRKYQQSQSKSIRCAITRTLKCHECKAQIPFTNSMRKCIACKMLSCTTCAGREIIGFDDYICDTRFGKDDLN
ncbi:unnamed protein product [Parnassius apollo]|uniref:(apollo) hypothetical protein n=1 Tax=Parnassius apollo TaxID=110799 RepID=A0A8S3XDN5_PARAO|nr:unnamed protein product [Parnassius apollo]